MNIKKENRNQRKGQRRDVHVYQRALYSSSATSLRSFYSALRPLFLLLYPSVIPQYSPYYITFPECLFGPVSGGELREDEREGEEGETKGERRDERGGRGRREGLWGHK